VKITITKAQAEKIGMKALVPFTGEKDSWGYRGERDINLVPMADARLDILEQLLMKALPMPGIKGALADIATWRQAKHDAGGLKARTLKAYETLVIQVLRKTPNQWVFRKQNDQWLPYFVEEVEFHPEQKDGRDGYRPARVDVDLVHEELGGTQKQTVTFHTDDVRGMNVVQALARKNLYLATAELMAGHLADVERWGALYPKVGLQCHATGVGVDDVDGNKQGRRDSWYWRSTHRYPMVRNGTPGRVVVDVFREEDGRDRDRDVRPWFWDRVRRNVAEDDADDDLGEDIQTSYVPEVPIHPNLVVFDLARHLRLRVHCRQLTEHQYDTAIGAKLVLDDDRKALVRLLIERPGEGFKDIVAGKGGGAVVLLAGPPGTGKTLTAEVYAEAESRPLYSVQCSQLGTDPDSLEEELLKVFTRGKRWNAVMLLDEADVYVHARGNDLHQNAIVGVFLRVLEYQDAVLFLTTNRPDDVDDAIASRCIARMNYAAPSATDQARLWRVLADTTGATLADDTIGELVADNRGVSGRDVKNLLKLALMTGAPVTVDTVRFVRQFQPTKAATK